MVHDVYLRKTWHEALLLEIGINMELFGTRKIAALLKNVKIESLSINAPA